MTRAPCAHPSASQRLGVRGAPGGWAGDAGACLRVEGPSSPPLLAQPWHGRTRVPWGWGPHWQRRCRAGFPEPAQARSARRWFPSFSLPQLRFPGLYNYPGLNSPDSSPLPALAGFPAFVPRGPGGSGKISGRAGSWVSAWVPARAVGSGHSETVPGKTPVLGLRRGAGGQAGAWVGPPSSPACHPVCC